MKKLILINFIHEYGTLPRQTDVSVAVIGEKTIKYGIKSFVLNFLNDKFKQIIGRDDFSGLDEVGSGTSAGNWISSPPSQEKMKKLAENNQYFLTSEEIDIILENTNDE